MTNATADAPPIQAPDWAGARSAFETTPEHPVDIARRCGVGHFLEIYSCSRKDNWSPYPGERDAAKFKAVRRPKRTPTPPTATPTTRTSARKPKRQQMIERLYRVIDNNLSQLEDIMQTQSDPSIADNEKETRTIGTVIGNIEKLKGLEDDAGKSRHATKSTPFADAAETERVRRELAERFYKLSQDLRT
jgi:hypothetical protein